MGMPVDTDQRRGGGGSTRSSRRKKSSSKRKSSSRSNKSRKGSFDVAPDTPVTEASFSSSALPVISSVPRAPTRRLNGDDKALMQTSRWSDISDLKLEDPVSLADVTSVVLQGVVAFVGKVHFDKGVWVGVQLTGPSVGKGYNDGAVNGKRYFANVGRKNGVFAPISKVQRRIPTKSGDKAQDRSQQMRKTTKAQMAEVSYVESLKKERTVAILKKNEEKQRSKLWTRFDDEEVYIQRLKQQRLNELRLSRAEPTETTSGKIKGRKLRFGGSKSKLCKADFQFVQGLQEAQQNFVLTDPMLPDHPITFASQAFLNMTGYSANEILGKNCRFLQGDETYQRDVDKIRNAIMEGADCSLCLLNYRKNGTPFWNQFFISALRDKRGRIKNYVGVQCEVSQEFARKQNRGKAHHSREEYVPEPPMLDEYSSMGDSSSGIETSSEFTANTPQSTRNQWRMPQPIEPLKNAIAPQPLPPAALNDANNASMNENDLYKAMQQQLSQMQQKMMQMHQSQQQLPNPQLPVVQQQQQFSKSQPQLPRVPLPSSKPMRGPSPPRLKPPPSPKERKFMGHPSPPKLVDRTQSGAFPHVQQTSSARAGAGMPPLQRPQFRVDDHSSDVSSAGSSVSGVGSSVSGNGSSVSGVSSAASRLGSAASFHRSFTPETSNHSKQLKMTRNEALQSISTGAYDLSNFEMKHSALNASAPSLMSYNLRGGDDFTAPPPSYHGAFSKVHPRPPRAPVPPSPSFNTRTTPRVSHRQSPRDVMSLNENDSAKLLAPKLQTKSYSIGNGMSMTQLEVVAPIEGDSDARFPKKEEKKSKKSKKSKKKKKSSSKDSCSSSRKKKKSKKKKKSSSRKGESRSRDRDEGRERGRSTRESGEEKSERNRKSSRRSKSRKKEKKSSRRNLESDDRTHKQKDDTQYEIEKKEEKPALKKVQSMPTTYTAKQASDIKSRVAFWESRAK